MTNALSPARALRFSCAMLIGCSLLLLGATVVASGENPASDHSSAPTTAEIFNVKNYGAIGDGVADDAPAVAAALKALSASEMAGKTLYFPKGTYTIKSDHVPSTWGPNPTRTAFPFAGKTSAFALGDGPVKIKGDGKNLSIIQTPGPRTLFDAYLGTKHALDLVIQDLTFKYTGGWNTTSNCTALLLGSGHTATARITNCVFQDFTTAIYGSGSTGLLEVRNSDFHYTHGRASIAQADPTFQFPCVAILEVGAKTLLQKCRFNGLLETTFLGVKSSAPASQKCALDGFVKTNSSGADIRVRNNSVLNNNIEGILIDPTSADRSTLSTRIEGNEIVGALAHSTFYYGIRGGVVACRSAIITDNIISQQGGLAFGGITLSLPAGADAQSKSRIEDNTITDCWNGIIVKGTTGGTIVQNNIVRGWSQYPPDEVEAGFGAARIGIDLIECTGVVVRNNLVDGGAKEGWWYRSSIVSPQQGERVNTVRRVYVSDPTVFSVGDPINLIKKVRDGRSHRFAGITAIGADYIDLVAEWANASQFGTNASAGDLIVSYKLGAPIDPTRIGAIHAFRSTGTRVVGNGIRNFTRAFNPSDLGSEENFVEMDSVDE